MSKLKEIAGYSTDEHELMIMNGFDDCIAGVVERFGERPIVCYDYTKIIDKLQTHSNMSYDEAVEYHEYNQLGAWIGPGTPCFITVK